MPSRSHEVGTSRNDSTSASRSAAEALQVDASRVSAAKPVAAGSVGAAGAFALYRFAARALMASFELLVLWQDRATRRHQLSMIEGHSLRDIGLSRADLEPEMRKPFWRSSSESDDCVD